MWKSQFHSLGDLDSDNIYHTIDPKHMHGSGSHPA